jgi:hypothetical protein
LHIRWNIIGAGLITFIVLLYIFSIINTQFFAISLIAAIIGLVARDDDDDDDDDDDLNENVSKIEPNCRTGLDMSEGVPFPPHK